MLTALLVRHADIDLPPFGGDPELNASGQVRAATLARMASSAGLSALFTSSFVRTRQTVAPLAAQLGIVPQEAPGASESPICSLQGRPVRWCSLLVTATQFRRFAALGAPGPPPTIAHREFDSLFVLMATAPGQTGLLSLKYGAPTS